MRRRTLNIIGALCLIGLLALNLLAFMHSRAMMTFSDGSSRTQSPENLNFISKVKLLTTGVSIPRPENSGTPESIGLAYQPHGFKGVNGTALEAWHIPTDNADVLVVLFHGYSSSKASLLPIARELNSMGFSTLLVDFYGSGGSGSTDTTVGYLESIDVDATFNYVKEMWPDSKIVMYGQSMGGVAILRAVAIHGTNPNAIIIESAYDKMTSTVKNRFTAMGLPSFPLAELLVFWGGVQSGFNAFKHNPVDYARSVTQPTLVLHGFLDPRVTSEQARAIHDQLAGWKQYSNFADAAHLATLATDAAQWRLDVLRVIDRVKAK